MMTRSSYILALVTVFVTALLVSIDSLSIEAQPQIIRPGEGNVVVSCSGDQGSKTLQQLYRMRLMRLGEDDRWSEVAVLQFDGTIKVTDEKATAIGALGDVPNSYLNVNWPVAPDYINARYRCDAIARTNTGDVIKVQSKEMDLKNVSTDVSLLLERLQKSESHLIGEVKETLHSVMTSSETDFLSAIDSKFGDLKEYLDNKTAIHTGPPEDKAKIMHWPGEEFSLLMPSAGCPLHPPAWLKSFKKMKAGPEDIYYPLNVPLHLAKPHKRDGFIYRQFCSLPASTERNESWPAGSYCLYSLSRSSCPSGFKFSEAKVKVLDDEENFYLYYSPTHSHTSGYFVIGSSWFCCRHDASPLTPIELPVSHPFYLFRHGSRCQAVKGMNVTQDVFMMETVEDADYDKWTDSNDDFHPDLSFNPYKEELCYYSKSRN